MHHLRVEPMHIHGAAAGKWQTASRAYDDKFISHNLDADIPAGERGSSRFHREVLNAESFNQPELSSWENPLIISLDFKGCPDKENLNGSGEHYLIYAVCIITG